MIVADDAMLTCEGIVHLLRDAGVDVVAQADEATGLLREVLHHSPDVAIVDIKMPPTHTDEGLVCGARIRDRFPDVAVLVLSQYLEPSYAMRLLENHPEKVGYLLKERVFSAVVLVDALHRVCDGETVVDPTIVARLFGRHRDNDPLRGLSPREHEVLALVARRTLQQSNRRASVRCRPHGRGPCHPDLSQTRRGHISGLASESARRAQLPSTRLGRSTYPRPYPQQRGLTPGRTFDTICSPQWSVSSPYVVASNTRLTTSDQRGRFSSTSRSRTAYRWCCHSSLRITCRHSSTVWSLPRVAGAVGRDAVPLQLLRLRAGDHFAYLVHALPAQSEHLVERRVGLRVDAPAARTGEPRSSQAPRVVRVGDPLHHPPQPAVRDQHEVTVRLDEAPLALDLLVEDRFGQLPRPGDSPSPEVFDHRPGVSQALGVCRPQLVALGPQPDALGIATFHL